MFNIKKILLIIILITTIMSWCSSSSEWKKEQNKQNNINNEKVILALWDSLTAWYWLDRESSYPSQLEILLNEAWYNYRVINWWISWETSNWLLSRASIYLRENPDLVIIVSWGNDWLRWLSTFNLKDNLNSIIDIFSNENINVILGWMDIPQNLWPSYRENFINVYKEINSERDDIYFIDFFLEWVAWIRDLNLNDQIHPNKEWYEIISNNLYKFLEKNSLISK